MSNRVLLLLTLAVLAAGCTSGGEAPPLTASHPASPDASESPVAPPTTTLAIKNAPPSAPVEQPAGAPGDINGKGSSMPGMQHDHRPAATQPATTQAAAAYTCVMHAQVASDKPGKCPICGMKLKLKQDTKVSSPGGHE